MPFFSSSALPYGPCAWYCWGMRILLIDDDVELCSLLEELLKREGFEARIEHDGARGSRAATCSRREDCKESARKHQAPGREAGGLVRVADEPAERRAANLNSDAYGCLVTPG